MGKAELTCLYQDIGLRLKEKQKKREKEDNITK